MLRIVNECCDCATGAYPCRGEVCANRHVRHYYCDHCDEEVESDELYDADGEELCEACFIERTLENASKVYA